MQQGTFYAGNYAAARDENEVHLNGAMFIQRADVMRVGGYEECIQTYGWDDEELYARLRDAGLRKLNISYDHVSQGPHADNERAQRDVSLVQVEVDLNSLLLNELPKWNSSALSHFKQLWALSSNRRDDDDDNEDVSSQYTVLPAVSRPRALKEVVPMQPLQHAWNTPLWQRPANDYRIPWDIMVTMPARRADGAGADADARTVRVLFAHVMHGLGNRLRALGSAMAFANATDRELVLIWDKDAHIAAEFSELLEADDMLVLTRFKPKWPSRGYEQWGASWRLLDKYNYMEMEGVGVRIRDGEAHEAEQLGQRQPHAAPAAGDEGGARARAAGGRAARVELHGGRAHRRPHAGARHQEREVRRRVRHRGLARDGALATTELATHVCGGDAAAVDAPRFNNLPTEPFFASGRRLPLRTSRVYRCSPCMPRSRASNTKSSTIVCSRPSSSPTADTQMRPAVQLLISIVPSRGLIQEKPPSYTSLQALQYIAHDTSGNTAAMLTKLGVFAEDTTLLGRSQEYRDGACVNPKVETQLCRKVTRLTAAIGDRQYLFTNGRSCPP
ncbi:Galactosyltransferase [Gracilaria domingensis]|nr:Galactosyltransferase [Gracilaria domingensis]